MKAINYSSTCTCENQHLLSSGCVCEICMGIVPEHPMTPASNSRPSYDPEYFEALEQMQADAGLAA